MENNILSQKSEIEATVIIPTFGRADFIIWALRSARQQTIRNIEIFVVGDGADPATKDIVEKEAGRDPRIRFFDNPKGERNGELNRHQALLQSNGRIICYLGHDDLWFPEHVESMLLLLREADFGHSMYTYIDGNGIIHGCLPLISDPLCRSRMLHNHWNRFGPTCSAHTREIYFKLPYGWRPAPLDIWSDLYMWRQFISHPDCRFTSLLKTTTISFPRSLRYDYQAGQREAEIAKWFSRLSLPAEADKLSEEAVQNAAGDLQREIINLENKVIENLRKLPATQANRPLVPSILFGKLYLIIDRFIPGRLNAFKNTIIEQMIKMSGLFNSHFYLERYLKSGSLKGFNPLRHYLETGWKSGKNPSPYFDANYYLTTHPDVLEVGMNPLVHYILYGYREKRAAVKLLD